MPIELLWRKFGDECDPCELNEMFCFRDGESWREDDERLRRWSLGERLRLFRRPRERRRSGERERERERWRELPRSLKDYKKRNTMTNGARGGVRERRKRWLGREHL